MKAAAGQIQNRRIRKPFQGRGGRNRVRDLGGRTQIDTTETKNGAMRKVVISR